MQQDVASGLFVEAVWFDSHLYGTSYASLAELQYSRTILDISNPLTILRLKQNGFSPIVIFVRYN